MRFSYSFVDGHQIQCRKLLLANADVPVQRCAGPALDIRADRFDPGVIRSGGSRSPTAVVTGDFPVVVKVTPLSSDCIPHVARSSSITQHSPMRPP
jgi:hypothetical protein